MARRLPITSGKLWRGFPHRRRSVPAALGERLPADGTPQTSCTSTGRGPGDFAIPGRSERMHVMLTPSCRPATETLVIRCGARSLSQSRTCIAVISETAARRWWPGEDPVGQIINQSDRSLEIVGVVADVERFNIDARGLHFADSFHSIVYLPMRDAPPAAQYFLAVRTISDPLALAHAVREAIGGLGGVVAEMDTMDRGIENATWQNEQVVI